MLNNGSGVFAANGSFDSGVSGEYGLNAGDFNGDGIADLVVGGNGSQQVRVLLGNGNGTFTGAAAQSSGGSTWVVVTGDVNGDGDLDVAAANSFSGNVGVLLGNGDGTFASADARSTSAPHVPSVDLGDLDGDGDLDLVLSSFGGGFWRRLHQQRLRHVHLRQEITAPNAPSCSILVDIDNDGDLDMALTDEIADVVVLMRNGPVPPVTCPPAPQSCRAPFIGGKAVLKLKDDTANDGKDQILWKWIKGAATTKPEFGTPLTTEDYTLCVYNNGALAGSATAEAGGLCGTSQCWADQPEGYLFKDKEMNPFGAAKVQLRAGGDGSAKILFRAKGVDVDMPPVASINGPIDVQLIKSSGVVCWSATYSAPFIKDDGVILKDKAD